MQVISVRPRRIFRSISIAHYSGFQSGRLKCIIEKPGFEYCSVIFTDHGDIVALIGEISV